MTKFIIKVEIQCGERTCASEPGGQIIHTESQTFDQLGRICTIGLHFSEAERDNACPIDVFLTRPSDQVEGGAA